MNFRGREVRKRKNTSSWRGTLSPEKRDIRNACDAKVEKIPRGRELIVTDSKRELSQLQQQEGMEERERERVRERETQGAHESYQPPGPCNILVHDHTFRKNSFSFLFPQKYSNFEKVNFR